MNNTLEGINNGITEAEEWIDELQDSMVDITATEQNMEKRMKVNEDRLRDLCGNIKCTNGHMIRFSEEERERERT